jgi:chemotaxis protein MotA
MKFVGLLLVFAFTFGGLVLTAGMEKSMHLIVGVMGPAAPGEFMIIFGCGLAAFIIGNSVDVLKKAGSYMSALSKPHAYSKEDYIEMFSALYMVFKLARTKGWLALEQHIEVPAESELFKQFPKFQSNHHGIAFVCDYLRIISLGKEDPHELGDLMDAEIEVIEHHEKHPGHAVQTMADGLPALGIVAAVLGVIKTMASINEPPEILGKLIASALVGTFLGVWLSYAFVAPIATAMLTKAETEVAYYKAMKIALIAFLNGTPPQVAVEFARKTLPHEIQPTFLELEEKLNELPSVA